MANPEDSYERPYLANLPMERWFQIIDLYQWKDFWLAPQMVEALISTQAQQFEFFPDDIILSSTPKSGTTWLKALVFSIVNRKLAADDPLLTYSPHQLVPFLEYQILTDKPELSAMYSPPAFGKRRLFATHLPHQLLPESIKNSGCRIVYITRNPRDTFISGWHFAKTLMDDPVPIEDGFEKFCMGISPTGPFFDHVLGYWEERENLHFVKYEELKEDPWKQVKKLAEFVGCPLDSEEEVDDIVWRCSHDRLSNLEINKSSELVHSSGLKNNSFFRKGIVGDWKNYLTVEMIERLDGITREKLENSGLNFQVSIKDCRRFLGVDGSKEVGAKEQTIVCEYTIAHV